ncbi:MAG: outer membrane beta-barrel domain-containing protein [Deltaproteobacteria bacterium]|nr:outer membrane beta-barrel domain-containing protein [Deltaproteobacteria bacterium]
MVHSSRGTGALRFFIAPMLFVMLAYCPVSRADEDELDYGKIYAVQPREYRMNHEFSLSLAFLPLDAFYKYFAIGGEYVLHIDDFWAWQVIHFSFSQYMDVDTGLKKELHKKWDASATSTPKLKYFLDTSVMLKLLYGKAAIMNDYVVQDETYLLLGAGVQHIAMFWFPAVNLGLGLRVFITKTISLRGEVREYIYFEEGARSSGGGVHSTLYLGLAFSYNAFAEEPHIEEKVK